MDPDDQHDMDKAVEIIAAAPMAGYGTHLRATRDQLVARVELLEALLKEVRLYQFPGYMEWLKRRDQALKDQPK